MLYDPVRGVQLRDSFVGESLLCGDPVGGIPFEGEPFGESRCGISIFGTQLGMSRWGSIPLRDPRWGAMPLWYPFVGISICEDTFVVDRFAVFLFLVGGRRHAFGDDPFGRSSLGEIPRGIPFGHSPLNCPFGIDPSEGSLCVYPLVCPRWVMSLGDSLRGAGG